MRTMSDKSVSFSENATTAFYSQAPWEDDFYSEEYCESTSGEETSSDERDGEFLEHVLDGVYSSRHSPSKRLDPVERDSLLIYDKDFFQEEELYSEGIARGIAIGEYG